MTDTPRYICPDCGRPVSQATDSPDRGHWRHVACIVEASGRLRVAELIAAGRRAARAEQENQR